MMDIGAGEKIFSPQGTEGTEDFSILAIGSPVREPLRDRPLMGRKYPAFPPKMLAKLASA